MENLSLNETRIVGEYIKYMEIARNEGREAARRFINALPKEEGKAIDSAVCFIGKKFPERWALK